MVSFPQRLSFDRLRSARSKVFCRLLASVVCLGVAPASFAEAVSATYLGAQLYSKVNATQRGPALETRLEMDSNQGVFARNQLTVKNNKYKHQFTAGIARKLGGANYSLTVNGETTDYNQLAAAKKNVRLATKYRWLTTRHTLEEEAVRSEGGLRLSFAGATFDTSLGRENSLTDEDLVKHFVAFKTTVRNLSLKARFREHQGRVEEQYSLAYKGSKYTKVKVSRKQNADRSTSHLSAATDLRAFRVSFDLSQKNWSSIDSKLTGKWTIQKNFRLFDVAVRFSHENDLPLDSSVMLSLPKIRI